MTDSHGNAVTVPQNLGRSPSKALGYTTRRHLCVGAAPRPVLRVSQKLVCAGLSELAEGREAQKAFFLQCGPGVLINAEACLGLKGTRLL